MSYDTKFKFTDLNGKLQEGGITVQSYAEAAAKGLSLSQHMAQKFPTDETKYGPILAQAMASIGLNVRPDNVTGVPSTKLSSAFSMNLGAITSPDGTGSGTPAGRLFFPEVILQSIAKELTEDKGDFFAGYESLLSGSESVNAPEFKRVRIDNTAPEASASMSTGQLAEPAVMVKVTAADTTTPIPTKGIGLLVSDQALQHTSFDLVNTIMMAQARGERIRMVEDQLDDVFNGNTDLAGMAALPTFNADTLDATIGADGVLTQKAWIHFLRQNYQKMTVTNIVCTLNTALAIEGRTNKPTNVVDDPNSPRIDSLFNIDNLGITAPRVFLVGTNVLPDNRMVGLDNAYALRRYINVSASYEAIESFVIRRATAFRVDHGEALTRLFDDAFTVMDLTDT
jgi:hypothetical protein